MTKITDKMRRDWLMRSGTSIRWSVVLGMWCAGTEANSPIDWAATTKLQAIDKAIRAEQKSKVKK